MAINAHQVKQFIKHFFTAKRKGHGVHSPFAYQLCENVFYNQDHFYDFETLNTIRLALLSNNSVLEIQDLGAGSKTFSGTSRKVKDIAAKGISSKKQSELIYRLINYLNCKNCVELGTSLGLNTLYVARVNKNIKVTSIEGSKALCDFARQLALDNSVTNIHFVNARFEDVLPTLISETESVDLLYVDGNHTYDATINYFVRFLSNINEDSVFIFDDIYWSSGMTKAWEEIKQHASVTLSIDLFYFGMVFFKPGIKEKVDLKLYI